MKRRPTCPARRGGTPPTRAGCMPVPTTAIPPSGWCWPSGSPPRGISSPAASNSSFNLPKRDAAAARHWRPAVSSMTWTPCWRCTSASTPTVASWWSTPPSFSAPPSLTWSLWGKPPMPGSSPTRATMPWRRPAWPPRPCSASPATATA